MSVVYLNMAEQDEEKITETLPIIKDEVAMPTQDTSTDVQTTPQEHLENKVDAINSKKFKTPR
jgi:hypothetical protein